MGWIMGIIVTAVDVAFQGLYLAVIIQSFFPGFPALITPYHPVVRLSMKSRNPFWAFRRFIPPAGVVDFSPLIAILILQLIRQVVIGILWRIL